MNEEYLNRKKPDGEFVSMPDDNQIICRCEEITKGEIRKAIYDGMLTMTEIKRYLRPGMGLCQGMTCGRNVKSIVARELKIPLNEVEEPTPRAPMRPIALSNMGNEKDL